MNNDALLLLIPSAVPIILQRVNTTQITGKCDFFEKAAYKYDSKYTFPI